MTSPRARPPMVADERTQLVGWLDLQRAIVQLKCEGLSDDDACRSVLPTSPLTTVAGVVSHLRWTEHLWFEVIFRGHGQDENPQFDDAPDADFTVGDTTLEQLVAEYARQCEASNRVVARSSLDDIARHEAHGGASLRWILQHMLEETARHAGHLDIVRELLDGDRSYW